MKIAAYRGSRFHAPENSRQALLAAYTAGADVLKFSVQLTADHRLVVTHDATISRLTGASGHILDHTLAELGTYDFSKTFNPHGVEGFAYYRTPPSGLEEQLSIEIFEELLELLPRDIGKLIELRHTSSRDQETRAVFIAQAVQALLDRDMVDEAVVYSLDPQNLLQAHARVPQLRIATIDWNRSPVEQYNLMSALGADGLVTEITTAFGTRGNLTGVGQALAERYKAGSLRVGAVLYPNRNPYVLTLAEYHALRTHPFIWSVVTDTMLGAEVEGQGVDMAALVGRFRPWIDISMAGVKADPKTWAFDPDASIGLRQGIAGDFVAEVSYDVLRPLVPQSICEVAVLNAELADSSATFFCPEVSSPSVGVVHTVGGGYHITWNQGTPNDALHSGPVVGMGNEPKTGWLRLERRNSYFSAYYRNDVDAPHWICVGSLHNTALAPVVYLRFGARRENQQGVSDLVTPFQLRSLTIKRTSV